MLTKSARSIAVVRCRGATVVSTFKVVTDELIILKVRAIEAFYSRSWGPLRLQIDAFFRSLFLLLLRGYS